MTYDEVLAAISLLLERLKKPFTKEEKGKSSKEEALNAIYARADALHLNSNGEKWTREELYERLCFS